MQKTTLTKKSLSPKTVQKYSFKSPSGVKYKMTVTQGVRTLTKNGQSIPMSKLPSPARRGLMQSVLRRSSSGEGGKKGLEGVPIHVLAVIAKDFSVFQVIEQLCQTSYSMLQNVCINKTFWNHWLENQTPHQLLNKMTDWFLFFSQKKMDLNAEIVKFISMFFIKHPKGVQSIPFPYLLNEYETKVNNFKVNKSMSAHQAIFEKYNPQIMESIDPQDLEDAKYMWPDIEFLPPLYHILVTTYFKFTPDKKEKYVYTFQASRQVYKRPMYFLLNFANKEYFLTDKRINSTKLFGFGDISFWMTHLKMKRGDFESFTWEQFIRNPQILHRVILHYNVKYDPYSKLF